MSQDRAGAVRGTSPRRSVVVRLVCGVLCGLAWWSAGCGAQFPADPNHTLDRIRGGVLRVGASTNEPWIVWADEAEPTGREADLVRRFASTHGARVEWSRGSEETLMGRLEDGELDLVAAGLTSQTPWAEKAAITKPYTEAAGRDGTPESHVLAVPLGENAFLLALEQFLDESGPGRR